MPRRNGNIDVKLGPTVQMPAGIEAYDYSGAWADARQLEESEIEKPTENRYPDAIVELDKNADENKRKLDRVKRWLDEQLQVLQKSHRMKEDEWEKYEVAYRANADFLVNYRSPFEEGSTEVVPAIAMAVEPVCSRLSIGIFKQKPVFTVTPISKRMGEIAPAIQEWFDYKQKHQWKLRKISSPRLVDFAKLGTCVFKTVYDRDEAPRTRYDYDKESGQFTVVKKKEVYYKGSRVKGIPLQHVMFPAGYETSDDCPIIAERLAGISIGTLRMWEASGKLANVNKIVSFAQQNRDPVTDTQIMESGQDPSLHEALPTKYNLWEVWFDFDVDEDGYDECMCCYWHEEAREFLMLRYNWYWHQKKPYDLAPYLVSPGSVYGVGLAEMILPFQIALTRWQRMASDNAYLANTRMFVAKRNAPGIEQVPRIYSGRTFFVDNPKTDFLPFQAGEIYPSTLTERQNIFGLVEKRTGVSDYLTGRESPVIGSRATATSTIALIQEGTKRVEETMENLREMYSSILKKALYIEIQYGTEGYEDIIFPSDDTAEKIKAFFDSATEANVTGLLEITLAATDAAENKQAKQQMQLAIINMLMAYYEKSLEAATSVLTVGPQLPGYAEMVSEILTDARKMYKDLLQNYDVPDPESYLPDLTKYLNLSSQGVGGQTGAVGSSGGLGDESGLAALLATGQGGASNGIPTNVRGRGGPLIDSLTG